MSRRQADVATPRRRGHASTQTSDSALEELVNLKLAVAAQGAELEELRAELPKLQAQSERTAVAEASQRVVEAASSAVPGFGSCVPPQGAPGGCAGAPANPTERDRATGRAPSRCLGGSGLAACTSSATAADAPAFAPAEHRLFGRRARRAALLSAASPAASAPDSTRARTAPCRKHTRPVRPGCQHI